MRKPLLLSLFLAPLLATASAAQQNSTSLFHSRTAATDRTDAAPPVIGEIVFVGLRRISPAALTHKMVCREGEPFSPACVEYDLHTLARLGWFESVRVERSQMHDSESAAGTAQPRVRLTFFVPELPFLARVEYHGSRLLSRFQIEKLLAEKNLTPKPGEPENRFVLDRGAKEMERALQELGHPYARVAVYEEVSGDAMVRVRFEIDDGAHLPIGQVSFTGTPAVPEKKLRSQMQLLRPGALFAGLRRKNAYTEERFREDRERLLAYYQNHGYPQARIGEPDVTQSEKISRKWLPWPHRSTSSRLMIEIPVESGPLYTIDSAQAAQTLQEAAVTLRRPAPSSRSVRAGQPYSAEAIEDLRRAWQEQLRGKAAKNSRKLDDDTLGLRTVEAVPTPDTAAHTMRIDFRVSDSPPYTVRRLQFVGIHRFPDRYFRKRIGLEEGAPLDERALEAGLARLGRTGYFKPIKKEDIHLEISDVMRTADLTIRVEERGVQRMSLSGGSAQFGSTLGIAYMLYNVLDQEELLSSRIEGGPEMLQIALGLAKEGFLGSRGTLALSVFNTLLRPRLVGTTKGPFFKQQTEALSADWNYAMTATDAMKIDYGVSHSKTQYSSGLLASDARTASASSSHALGLGWERNAGDEQITLSDSVSGGWLGGSENLLRTRAEYGRVFPDPIFNSRNAWAFRTSLGAVGSYSGAMPLYARWFAGDQFVRGVRDGELGPLGEISSVSSSGSTVYSAAPTGANAIGAVNAEYRFPLASGTEAATFFDLGSGRMLPNWLGPGHSSIINATNGVLHGSTGVELRWRVPGIGVPVRGYYALNLLRLNRVLALPHGSLFRAQNRFSTPGWGLGSMF